jgi:NitT/TauT family transport system permease protein
VPSDPVNAVPRDGADVTVWQRWFALVWPPLLAAVIFLTGWEFIVWWFKLPNFVLPGPVEIVTTAAQEPERVLIDTWTTVVEALTGYLAGTVLGLGLAIFFATFSKVERLVLPIYVTINSVPMVAYGPLAIILLGIGPSSKVLLITIAVSYQVLINALAGLRSCDPGAIALLRTFGASKRTILLKLRMPGAMPAIMFGLRVAVVHAMILAVVLEMLGARAGLGWSIYKSTQMMYFVGAWVAVGASVIVSLLIYGIISQIGRKFVWW